VTKVEPFRDDFNDGNYTGWSAWSSTWDASNHYLTRTSGAGGIGVGNSDPDFDLWFSYYDADTSNNAYTCSIYLRVLTGAYVRLIIRPDCMYLYQLNGGQYSNLAVNYNATTSQGVWYDVYVRCDGSNMEVWRAQRGSGAELAQVLTTSSAAITTTNNWYIVPDNAASSFRFDNFQFVSDSHSSTTTCSYDNANELLTMATGGANTTFTYDDWGRTTSKAITGHLATYAYLYGDKLRSVTTTFPDETTVAYNYDGLGKRRNKTNGNGLTWWRWDVGYNVIEEYNDPDTDWDIENLSMTYVPGLAEIVTDTGAYRYYSEDHLGSVRRIRDANKASLATYEYDPYGGQYAFSGLALNHGFTGHTWEADAALYYAPYRYYGPAVARWLTPDPVGMIDGLNVYGYVGGNPANFSDSLGLLAGCHLWAETTDMRAYSCPVFEHYKDWAGYSACMQSCVDASWQEFFAVGCISYAWPPYSLIYLAIHSLCAEQCKGYLHQTRVRIVTIICRKTWLGIWICKERKKPRK